MEGPMSAAGERERDAREAEVRNGAGAPAAQAERRAVATFRSIYTSRDGRLAVFEDERGHLTSVRTARFA
jgi:hypothetical protein